MRKDEQYILECEGGLMTKKAIRIRIKDPSHKLDPMSRLNYAKLYAVKHNVKVEQWVLNEAPVRWASRADN